jgi:hypothetical protein
MKMFKLKMTALVSREAMYKTPIADVYPGRVILR